MKKVFLTRKIDESAISMIRPFADLEIWPDSNPPSEKEILLHSSGCDGILTLLTDPITKNIINSNLLVLRVISQMAVGVDNIDLQEATRNRLPVGHTPGILTETTADFTWALLLAAARRVVESSVEVREGIWRPWGPDVLCGLDIHNATLGIIGLGRIGKAVTRRAAGFSMNVVYYEPERDLKAEQELGVRYLPLNDLLAQSDFITLHVYLTDATRRMIGKPQFEIMKPNAILINTSRGGVVDVEALYPALKDNKIRAAALDVFEPEPIPRDHPILKLKNLLLTPHIASASEQTRRKMALMAAENLIAGLSGKKLPYCANPEVYSVQ